MDLEQKIKELEARILKLEAQPKAQHPNVKSDSDKICKPCQAYTMSFVSTQPDKHFGDFGMTMDKYQCSKCGFEQEFQERNG